MNSRILEVGSGAGLSGLLAAKQNANPSDVVLTDNNEYVLDLLRKNTSENFANSLKGN